jgi:hypothetical protein
MEIILIMAVVALFTALLLGGIFFIISLVWKQLGKASGISKLAASFPSSYKPQGQDFSLRTIAVGSVRYRNCVYITVSHEGLYIRLRSVFPLMPKNPPLLIPWDRIKKAGEATIYWRTAHCLNIGEPKVATISVFDDVYQAALPYLKG